MGAPTRMTMPIWRGIPFFNNRLITGIMAHSQTGKRALTRTAGKRAIYGFFGIRRWMNSSETNTWIRADANTPSKIKGIASSTMLKKMEFTFNKDAGMAKSFVFISTKKKQ